MSDELEVLRLAYQDVLTERDRLRGARGSFTKTLGPLPASAAIVIGLVGSVAGRVGVGWLAGAAVLLVVLIVIGLAYADLPPYRLLRGARQPAGGIAFSLDAKDEADWLRRKIELEEELCGKSRTTQRFNLRREVDNLQDALDVERWASVLVQLLFAEIVVALVLGITMQGVTEWVQWLVGGLLALGTLVALLVLHRRHGLLA